LLKNRSYNTNRLACNKVYVRICLLLGVSLLTSVALRAQYSVTKVVLEYSVTEQKEVFLENYSRLKLSNYINSQLDDLREEGFWLARVRDSVELMDTLNVYLQVGEEVLVDRVSIQTLPEDWKFFLERKLQLTGVPLAQASVQVIMDEVLDYAQNNGYPFAQVWLDSPSVDKGLLSLKLQLDKGPAFVLHDIQFDDEIKMTRSFLLSYLGVKPGEAFNHDKVNAIGQRISGLPYIQLKRDPLISFSDEGKARIWLDLENQRVSNLDGIIGVAPGSTDDGRTLLTGELDFNLRNPFSRGTSLDFSFEKFQESSQRLDLAISYPFMFSSPLGTGFDFNLERVDTLYANLNTKLGISYYFSGSSSFMVFFNRQNSYPISSSEAVRNRYSNIEINHYGLSGQYQRLDYIPNPSKGLRFAIEGSVGRKSVEDLEASEVNTVYRFSLEAEYFFRISRLFTLVYSNQTLLNLDTTFSNGQVKWIGGLTTLRGFNESAIPSKDYIIQGLEFRLLTDKNSHAKLFYDYGLVWQLPEDGEIVSERYSGAGIGYSFITGPGLFTINYALALNANTGIAFSNGKVHFGFISYF